MASVLPVAEEVGHEPLVESLPVDTRDSQVYTPVSPHAVGFEDHHDMFADEHQPSGGDAKPRTRKLETKKSGGWHWLIIGVILHLSAAAALILFFMKIGPFAESPTTEEERRPPAKKPADSKKLPKNDGR